MFDERKHFLDWLRAAAFGFLILFHIGMLYVPWSYNIKSGRILPGLEYLMIVLSPWRLALLFFISGVASRFLLEKKGPGGFAAERIRRLFVVLLLGMYVINPVQVYVEFLHKGLIEPGYLDFWINDYLPGEPFPNRQLPTWDHLWFLLYLLIYALALALISKVIRLVRFRGPVRIPLPFLFIVPGLWLCLANVLIQEFSPATMALFDDWGNHLRWIGVFAAGAICAGRDCFWKTAGESRHLLLLMAIAALVLHEGYGVYSRTVAVDPALNGVLYGVISGIYGWAVILALMGFAFRYLNFRTRLLRYLTDAVLPIYVVHQPIMLAAAYVLFPLSMPLPVEVVLLISITGIGSLAVYEMLVRRWRVSRFLFGLKASLRVSGHRSAQSM